MFVLFLRLMYTFQKCHRHFAQYRFYVFFFNVNNDLFELKIFDLHLTNVQPMNIQYNTRIEIHGEFAAFLN